MSRTTTSYFLLHTFWCRIWIKKNSHFGAKFRKQRTGIFLASEIYGSYLSWLRVRYWKHWSYASVWPPRPRDGWTGSSTRNGPEVKGNGYVVKDIDYLVDNLPACMLLEVKAGGQEKCGRAADPVPNWECRVHSPQRRRSENCWAARLTCHRPERTKARKGKATRKRASGESWNPHAMVWPQDVAGTVLLPPRPTA